MKEPKECAIELKVDCLACIFLTEIPRYNKQTAGETEEEGF